MSTQPYDRFIGQEVQVTKTELTREFFGQTHVFPHYEMDDNQPVIQEIIALRGDGKLRIWLPGHMGTADHVMSRLNVHIVEGEDGKFRISGVNWG